MNTRSLAVLLAVAALLAPLRAAAGALGEARSAGQNPAAYDGARALPEGDAVRASSTGDRRTPEEIAAAEQKRSGKPAAPAVKAPVPGDDLEVKPEKKSEWFTWPLGLRAIQGALVGLLIGSLFGMTGLIAGPLIGAALFYGVSKHMTDKAAKDS